MLCFALTLQIGDEFDYFKSDLAMQCLYGGVSYGPQGTQSRYTEILLTINEK